MSAPGKSGTSSRNKVHSPPLGDPDEIPSGDAERRGVPWFGVALSVLTLALALVRLGDSSLWADEAWPGLLGLQILKHGLPRVADGPLLIHWVEGDARGGLWIWDGWLQSYLSAAGEAIFGRTALGARFFHTLAGALIPFAAYPVFRAISPRRGVAEAATLLTALSAPLLIAIRQARYYPEGILLTILTIRAYHGAIHGRPRAAPLLVLWSVLLFHANWIWFFLLGLVFGAHLLLLRPPRGVVVRLAGCALASGAIILPFAVWACVWKRRVTEWGTPLTPNDPYQVISFLRHYLLEINLHVAPLVLILLAGAVTAGRARPVRAGFLILAALIFPFVVTGYHTPLAVWLFVLFLAPFAVFGLGLLVAEGRRTAAERGWMPESLVGLLFVAFIGFFAMESTYPFLRYLFPLWPFLLLLVAQSAFTLGRRTWIAWSLIGVLILTNALSVWPIRFAADHGDLGKLATAGRTPEELRRKRFPRWLRGFTVDEAFHNIGWGPEAEPSLTVRSPLAEYLDEISHPFRGPIDAIASYLNVHKRPGDRFFLMYEEYPVVFHTGLVPQRFNPFEQPPQWLIFRPIRPVRDKNIAEWLNRAKYRRTSFHAIDTPYQNREEPDLHLFRSATEGPSIVIAERGW